MKTWSLIVFRLRCFISLTLLTWLGCFSLPVLAKPINIGLFELPGLLSSDPDKQGKFNQIISLIKADLPPQYQSTQYYFYPPGRATRSFDQKAVDCLFPASTQLRSASEQQLLLQSTPVTTSRAFLFSNKPYTNLKEFTNQPIAINRGLLVGNVRNRFNFQFVELSSDKQTLEFLQRQRVKGVVGFYYDIKSAAQHQMPYFNPALPIHSSDDSFICHKKQITKTFVNSLNTVIQGLQAQGTIETIMSQ